MKKAELRKIYLLERKKLDYQEVQGKSIEIKDRFFVHFDLTHIQNIHIFLPILKHQEINTWPIIHYIWQYFPHIKVIVSKSDFSLKSMENFVLLPTTKIVANNWGIPEPENAVFFDDEQLEMVLLPLVIFDQRGNRVGYGKGFYDKFLSRCKPSITKVGLSLFEPVDVIEDAHDQDIPLDWAITPKNIFNFG